MLFFMSLSFMFVLGFSVVSKMDNVIFIDPGHGGYDGGAFVDDVEEAALNLEIALKLKGILEFNGYTVMLTRDGDYDLSTDDKNKKRSDIYNRVDMINDSNALLYISIHQNTYTNPLYSGAQCFYNKYCGLSQILAANIQDSIKSNLNNTTRVSKSIDGIYLVDNVYVPGVLVECGFMSNQNEFILLQDEDYQYKFANCIYYGILNYLLLV